MKSVREKRALFLENSLGQILAGGGQVSQACLKCAKITNFQYFDKKWSLEPQTNCYILGVRLIDQF